MRLPDVVLGGVVYLGSRMHQGFHGCALNYVGSGFIVSVEDDGISFLYLVTAGHVATELANRADPIARLNDRYGASFETEIGHDWEHHPDQSVDLAITSFTPRDDSVPPPRDRLAPLRSFTHAPDTMLVDEEQFGPNGIGVGDEVYIAGLFRFAIGEQSNSPILRVGNLAMIPRDRIQTRGPYGAMEAYLIEARSLGGLSGAPVFVRETVALEAPVGPYDRFDQHRPQFHGSGRFFILGVAQGHWDSHASELSVEQEAANDQSVNIGIAIVTPARKIREILYAKRFTDTRKEHLALRVDSVE